LALGSEAIECQESEQHYAENKSLVKHWLVREQGTARFSWRVAHCEGSGRWQSGEQLLVRHDTSELLAVLGLLVAYYQEMRFGEYSLPNEGFVYSSGYWLALQYLVLLHPAPKHK
jgi:hypothetical protein